MANRSAFALVLSLLAHASLGGLLGAGRTAAPNRVLPNSVAFQGNSIEVDAPTPELAAAPGSPESRTASDEVPPPVDVERLPVEHLPAAPESEPPRSQDTTAPRKPPLRRPASTSPKPTASSAAAVASLPASRASDGASAPSSGAPAAGTFGQEGLAPGVRRLGYAFTRAIPAASPADPEWRELPAGPVGSIRIELTVDENNRLGAMKEWQSRSSEPAPPAVLRRMVERTLLLLRAGQFALSGSNQPGAERLLIEVRVSDETADPDGEAVVVQKGFDGASPGHPGKAHFRYGTGRKVEAKVTIVPAAR